MMNAHAGNESPDWARPGPDPDQDQRVFLRMSWAEFVQFLRIKGDAAVPRITYLDGVLELMSPSRSHERKRKLLARLVEAYAQAHRIRLYAYGSWTLKDGRKKGGAEPDECYMRGADPDEQRPRPDFVVEVVHTSGGLDRLEVYRRLGVPEVWNFEEGVQRIFSLRDDEYVEVTASEVVPEFDMTLLSRCMGISDQVDAIDALLSAVARG